MLIQRPHSDPSAELDPVVERFSFISDVALTVTAELDRRTISFAELVRLETGSIVSLNRPAGENIDIYIGDVLLGTGEILVIDGTLSIRVADLRDKQTVVPKGPERAGESPAAA